MLRTPLSRWTAGIAPVFVALVILAAPAVFAAPAPVTYLNANFGPPNNSLGINFYRSSGTIKLESATASVFARANGVAVSFSASADADPHETSSGFSMYDVGTVNVAPGLCVFPGSGSTCSFTVTPRFVSLSGSARFAMNLWFDSDHNGEYFVWEKNQFTDLGRDVYAIGPSSTGELTIDETTPLFLIAETGGVFVAGCSPGVFVSTLAVINAGGCVNIPPGTNVAVWVGIDIPSGSTGSGSATV